MSRSVEHSARRLAAVRMPCALLKVCTRHMTIVQRSGTQGVALAGHLQPVWYAAQVQACPAVHKENLPRQRMSSAM